MQVRISTYSPGDHYHVSCSVKYGKSNESKPRVNKHIVIKYRNFLNFDEEIFLRDLKNQNFNLIRVITKLPNSEQSSKEKVKTHKYINRQNQSTTGKP